MKTPRRQARSSVTSRKVPSPGWVSGSDIIFTPKSPSPTRRITRRSSIYQSKAARSDIARFKMPATLKSPPGAKTRARRSSVYQKGGKSVLSPRNLPVSSRTRRSSIYIRGTNADSEFSKVFRTPIKPVEAVKSISEETEMVAKINDEKKSQTKPGLKQVAAKTPSPTKLSKNKSMKEKAKSPVVKHSPVVKTVSKKKLKTPEKIHVLSEDASIIVNSTRSAKKTPATKLKSPKSILSAKESPKPVKGTHQKTPASAVSSPMLLKKTPAGKFNSPKATSSARKLPKAVHQNSPLLEAKMPTPLRKTQDSKLKSPKVTRSARKTPKPVKKTLQKSPAAQESVEKITRSLKKFQTTSTPSKTVEQITNKSFYGTPQESPLRNDAVIVFSAKSVSTANRSQKKITLTTPKVTSMKKTKSTPKRMPARKTPAVKRRFVESDDDSTPLEAKSRKIEKEVQSSIKKAIRKNQKTDTELEKETQPVKLKLSPVEMSSVLKSVHQQERQEKRKASESPSPRPSKLARLGSDSLTTTPRVMKTLKRTSPKKLAKIHELKQAYQEEWFSEGDSSMLNETVNTDSRSSRCVIL